MGSAGDADEEEASSGNDNTSSNSSMSFCDTQRQQDFPSSIHASRLVAEATKKVNLVQSTNPLSNEVTAIKRWSRGFQ